jgi:hypothetical protein
VARSSPLGSALARSKEASPEKLQAAWVRSAGSGSSRALALEELVPVAMQWQMSEGRCVLWRLLCVQRTVQHLRFSVELDHGVTSQCSSHMNMQEKVASVCGALPLVGLVDGHACPHIGPCTPFLASLSANRSVPESVSNLLLHIWNIVQGVSFHTHIVRPSPDAVLAAL